MVRDLPSVICRPSSVIWKLFPVDYILIEYLALINSAEDAGPPLCEAKVPQAAINVKGIYVVFDGWGHESTRIGPQ